MKDDVSLDKCPPISNRNLGFDELLCIGVEDSHPSDRLPDLNQPFVDGKRTDAL